MSNETTSCQYIAKQMRFIRKIHRLTQENLAEMANVSTRTIEKIESGNHSPNCQTLKSIATSLGYNDAIFIEPSPPEKTRTENEMKAALRKILVVPILPTETTSDFLNIFGNVQALRFDTSNIADDDALAIAMSICDYATDLNDVWDDVSSSDKLDYVKTVMKQANALRELGYKFYFGKHRQCLVKHGRADLVFNVGVLIFLPASELKENRHAIVHLEGCWEKLPEDTVSWEEFIRAENEE